MTRTIKFRFPEELNKVLEEIARVEQLDKASIVQKLLHQEVKQWYINTAIDRFQKSEISLGQAVAFSRQTIWDFLETMTNLKIPMHYDAEEFHRDLDTINKLIL